MKKIVLILLILIKVSSFSQVVSEVVKVDSTINKVNLYSNALSFFATEFKSANDVIQMKDAETGKVIGKGIVDKREITITISCKDGKYKYEIETTPVKKNITIILKTKEYGSWYKNGETLAKVYWIDGQVQIPLNEITYFSNTGTMGSASFNMVYGGVGKPAMTNKAYENWKNSVDTEVANLIKDYNDMSNPYEVKNKVIIDKIIASLKREMAKKTDW